MVTRPQGARPRPRPRPRALGFKAKAKNFGLKAKV